ncbi:hypothetical protein KO02_21505 [Sphingobacterium sp. ML3W]|uniref:hypothetical protein n=1 Tax=Sphingobacterium sp. ML3W TaxID=1538644 RepID=UPI0004F79FF0|nr:hypothetical protein [Sphingobacterium sp. ML3W]AIM38983.1 hypothetical protein KO02_21505 [Sphingobacterium sp. ML3W]
MKTKTKNTPLSLYTALVFDKNKPLVALILETPMTKELRICLFEGVIIKDHKSPFPIVIHVQEGTMELGVEGDSFAMVKGDLICLEGGVMHNLKALENTIVRLSILKEDKLERVEQVINGN